jgi:hypothetical protein
MIVNKVFIWAPYIVPACSFLLSCGLVCAGPCYPVVLICAFPPFLCPCACLYLPVPALAFVHICSPSFISAMLCPCSCSFPLIHSHWVVCLFALIPTISLCSFGLCLCSFGLVCVLMGLCGLPNLLFVSVSNT